MRMSYLNFLCQLTSNAINFTSAEKLLSRLDDRSMVHWMGLDEISSVHKVLKIMHLDQWAFKNVNDLGANTTAFGIKTKL